MCVFCRLQIGEPGLYRRRTGFPWKFEMPTLPTKSADKAARRSGSPTLVGVAREADVSVSTAGRVVRDGGWPVDVVLGGRVLVAADRRSYVPDRLARTLLARRPWLTGLECRYSTVASV